MTTTKKKGAGRKTSTTKAKKTGRPTKYTLKLADLICERLACGESMRSVCRDDDMPAISSVFKWMREHPEFSEQYTKAKEESADALFDDMLDIADNQAMAPLFDSNGQPVLGDDGKQLMAATNTSINHARLRVDVRKFHASKLKPKKYGEKQEVEAGDNLANAFASLAERLPG